MCRKIIVFSVFFSVFIGGLLLYRYKLSSEVTASTQIIKSGKNVVSTKHLHTIPKLTETPQPQQVVPEEYYQIIIDNNIFRPLNWEPPHRVSEYTLLGTAISTDGRSATAFILEQKTDQFYVVAVGDHIGNATVKKISKKQVTLTTSKDELKVSLSGPSFINPRRNVQARQSHKRIPQFSSAKEIDTSQKSKLDSSKSLQRGQDEWGDHFKDSVESIRAERNRMMERLRYLEQR